MTVAFSRTPRRGVNFPIPYVTAQGRIFAAIVRRKGPRFPFRLASYWDLNPWGHGFVPVTSAPGCVQIGENRLNIRTGEVTGPSALAPVSVSQP